MDPCLVLVCGAKWGRPVSPVVRRSMNFREKLPARGHPGAVSPISHRKLGRYKRRTADSVHVFVTSLWTATCDPFQPASRTPTDSNSRFRSRSTAAYKRSSKARRSRAGSGISNSGPVPLSPLIYPIADLSRFPRFERSRSRLSWRCRLRLRGMVGSARCGPSWRILFHSDDAAAFLSRDPNQSHLKYRREAQMTKRPAGVGWTLADLTPYARP